MKLNDESIGRLLSTSSGEAAYRAYSKVLDYQRSLMLRRLRDDAPDLYEDAVASLLELNRLSEAELLPPVVEGDLEAAGREEVERAVLGHVAGTFDEAARGGREPISHEESKAQADAVKKPKRVKSAIIVAAICFVLAVASVAAWSMLSDEGMQLCDVDGVLDAASSSEIEERFPRAKLDEAGNLEVKGSCGEIAGTYTVRLENDVPYLVVFTPEVPDRDTSPKDTLEAHFGDYDRYKSKLKYYEWNNPAADLLIKYYPGIGIYFYPN